MNTTKALECLLEYSKKSIKDKNKLSVDDDYGNRALILLCQSKYNYDFGLPYFSELEGWPPPPVYELRDAIFQSYRYDKIEELAERKYVADILLKRNFDTDFYINSITNLLKKSFLKGLSEQEKYEITHLCWCLIMIGKDNYILATHRDLLYNALTHIYQTSHNTDVGTEALYFLSLIDPRMIKEQWIISLSKSQNKDGCFSGVSREQVAHHTGLALLTFYNYTNEEDYS